MAEGRGGGTRLDPALLAKTLRILRNPPNPPNPQSRELAPYIGMLSFRGSASPRLAPSRMVAKV